MAVGGNSLKLLGLLGAAAHEGAALSLRRRALLCVWHIFEGIISHCAKRSGRFAAQLVWRSNAYKNCMNSEKRDFGNSLPI